MNNIFKKVTVFVSYSHDAHKESGEKVNKYRRMIKVENFCKSLEKFSINVIWDKEIKLGFDQDRFMMQLEKCDFVIILFTKDYQDKIINDRDGGVNYEYKLIKEKYENEKKIDTNIIPILFDGFTSNDLIEDTIKKLNYMELKDARTNSYNETIVKIVKSILPKEKNELKIILDNNFNISNKGELIIFFEHYFVDNPLFQPTISFELPEGYDEVISDYENIIREILEKNDGTKEDVKALRELIRSLNDSGILKDYLTKGINMFIGLYHNGSFHYGCIDSLFMIHLIETLIKISFHRCSGEMIMCCMKDDTDKRFYFYPEDIKWYMNQFDSIWFDNEVVKLPLEKIAYDIIPYFIDYILNPDVSSRNIDDFIIFKS